ncbi:MAG: hypothetical protein AB8D78_10435 [Akkermansiaceae bacterium]
MTPTRYVICRFAKAFGFGRKMIRMSDAASEMHLLKDAELMLGKRIWENVEGIEELSVEYWSIRKMRKERDRVSSELETCHKELEKAHEERAGLLGISEEPVHEFGDERRAVLKKLEGLAKQRDEIVIKAREVKRNYEGIKMKQEVLEKEDSASEEEVEKNKKRAAELKKEFNELKEKRRAVGKEIADGDERMNEIEEKIAEKKTNRRKKASEAFHQIGDTNQTISNLNAELGVLNTQMSQLYSEIGHFISGNYESNAECRAACKECKGLVEVMAALRRSVQYNYKLAENLS